MEVHGPHGVDGVDRVPGVGPGAAAKPPAKSAGNQPVDQVQISPEARLESLLAKVPEVRQDLIDRVRAEIEAGTYETDERLDTAIDRLLDDLKA
jgi:negative regulator of flagellin synthesis FlgM